jgi:hypothetical protein
MGGFNSFTWNQEPGSGLKGKTGLVGGRPVDKGCQRPAEGWETKTGNTRRQTQPNLATLKNVKNEKDHQKISRLRRHHESGMSEHFIASNDASKLSSHKIQTRRTCVKISSHADKTVIATNSGTDIRTGNLGQDKKCSQDQSLVPHFGHEEPRRESKKNRHRNPEVRKSNIKF